MTRACWMRDSLWFWELDRVHKHHVSMRNVVVIVERSWKLDKRWPNTSSTSTTVIESRYIDSLRSLLSVDHFQFSGDRRVDPNLKLRQGPKTLHTWFEQANTLTQLSTRGVAISNFDSLGFELGFDPVQFFRLMQAIPMLLVFRSWSPSSSSGLPSACRLPNFKTEQRVDTLWEGVLEVSYRLLTTQLPASENYSMSAYNYFLCASIYWQGTLCLTSGLDSSPEHNGSLSPPAENWREIQPLTFTRKRPRPSRHFCTQSTLGAGFPVQKHAFHMTILLQVSIIFCQGS